LEKSTNKVVVTFPFDHKIVQLFQPPSEDSSMLTSFKIGDDVFVYVSTPFRGFFDADSTIFQAGWQVVFSKMFLYPPPSYSFREVFDLEKGCFLGCKASHSKALHPKKVVFGRKLP
jgi:hypothetical protein